MPPLSAAGKPEKRRQAVHGPVNIQRSMGNWLQSRCNFLQAERPLRASILCPEGTLLCEHNGDGAVARQYTTLASKEGQADHRGLGPDGVPTFVWIDE
jgi:hypothetical protein